VARWGTRRHCSSGSRGLPDTVPGCFGSLF
jgi:hypothetical protein